MKKYNNNYPVNLDTIPDLLRQAGQIAIKRQRHLSYQLKKNDSIVTNVDKEIEEYLIDKITKIYPNYNILSEESGAIDKKSKYTWVIDPLDGTRVYYGGLPIWGISVGMLCDSAVNWGCFYMPVLDHMYIGTANGAFFNGERLSSHAAMDINSPTTFLAVPSQCHMLFDIKIKRLRSFGSLAAHLAFLARGAALGVLTQHANVWDIAAMLPILSSVGVTAKYLSRDDFELSDLFSSPLIKPLVFANSGVIDDICEKITLKKCI